MASILIPRRLREQAAVDAVAAAGAAVAAAGAAPAAATAINWVEPIQGWMDATTTAEVISDQFSRRHSRYRIK